MISPTCVPDPVNVTLDLLIDGASGIWHVTNGEPVTWAAFAKRAAQIAGASARSLTTCNSRDLALTAPRPRYSAMREQPLDGNAYAGRRARPLRKPASSRAHWSARSRRDRAEGRLKHVAWRGLCSRLREDSEPTGAARLPPGISGRGN